MINTQTCKSRELFMLWQHKNSDSIILHKNIRRLECNCLITENSNKTKIESKEM